MQRLPTMSSHRHWASGSTKVLIFVPSAKSRPTFALSHARRRTGLACARSGAIARSVLRHASCSVSLYGQARRLLFWSKQVQVVEHHAGAGRTLSPHHGQVRLQTSIPHALSSAAVSVILTSHVVAFTESVRPCATICGFYPRPCWRDWPAWRCRLCLDLCPLKRHRTLATKAG